MACRGCVPVLGTPLGIPWQQIDTVLGLMGLLVWSKETDDKNTRYEKHSENA